MARITVPILKSAVAANNNTLVDELIKQVIADIHADKNAGKVSNSHIKNFYGSRYYDAVVNVSIADNDLVQTLYNLIYD